MSSMGSEPEEANDVAVVDPLSRRTCIVITLIFLGVMVAFSCAIVYLASEGVKYVHAFQTVSAKYAAMQETAIGGLQESLVAQHGVTIGREEAEQLYDGARIVVDANGVPSTLALLSRNTGPAIEFYFDLGGELHRYRPSAD